MVVLYDSEFRSEQGNIMLARDSVARRELEKMYKTNDKTIKQ